MRAVMTLTRTARGALLVAALTVLAACSGRFSVDYDAPVPAELTKSIRVTSVSVAVPETLTVTEANILVPNADIVWHGEAYGDRRAQVGKIIETAGRQAVGGLRGSRPVVLSMTVTQFHAVTPAAVLRAPSAVHNIQFMAQFVDARTGEAVTQPTLIKADLPALVGEQALAMQREAGGLFLSYQKPRLVAHVTNVLKGWLGLGPDIRGSFSSLGR